MLRSLLRCLLVLLVLLFGSSHVMGQDAGGINGRVLDRLGQAALNVVVAAVSLDTTRIVKDRVTSTDSKGLFRFATIPAGLYRIYIWDDTRGIPDSRAVLFDAPGFAHPLVRVYQGKTASLSDVVLPPALSKLTLSVVDAVTKEPIPIVRCRLDSAEQPGAIFATDSLDSRFTFALPKRPISVKITSSGYMDWSYLDPVTGSDKLLPQSDLTIVVQLRRRLGASGAKDQNQNRRHMR